MAAVSDTNDGLGDARVEAQGEVAVAVLALDGGDLAHAADHVAAALHLDPGLPEAHEVLARLGAAAGGPEAALALYPPDRPYIGAMAARTHLLAAAGQLDAAVSLLAQVVAYDPSLPWSRVPWLERPGLAGELGADTILNALLALNRELPEPVPEPDRTAMAPLYRVLCAAVELHAHDAGLLAIGSGLARRMTAFGRAESFAERAYRLDPGRMSSIMLGNVYRAMDRAPEAIAVWTEQLRRDPSDDYLHVDLAELHADTGHPELGLPWLLRVVETTPDHEKAAPALLGLRYRIDRDTTHLVALADHLREYPEHRYAADLLVRFCADLPWLGGVHASTESIMNALRQVLDQVADPESIEIECAVSAIEPPSALMTVRRVIPRAEITVTDVGFPDPRTGTADWDRSGIEVWRYRDDARIAEPVFPRPMPESAEKIRRTAQLSWPHPIAAYDHAVALSGISLPGLLGALARPPAPRDDEAGHPYLVRNPDLWIRAVQVFACLGVAHHGVEQPWLESIRRTALFDLLHGPEDWVCEAAAMALVTVAWTDPDTREDIGFAICFRFVDLCHAASSRAVSILDSFCHLVLACPWVDETYRSLAWDMLARNAER
ncbi:hypothetical protein ACWIGI_09480 [Nocardia sp. NPDC055321]